MFSSVSVRLGTKPDSEGRVPVTFNARERAGHAVSVSGAYSSDLGGSTGVSWTKRNVSGRADSLTLSATAINLGGGTSSNGVGYDVNGKYLIPDWQERNQSLQVAAGAIRQFLDAYDQTAYTGSVTVNRKLSSILTLSAGLGLEQERINQHECNVGQCDMIPRSRIHASCESNSARRTRRPRPLATSASATPCCRCRSQPYSTPPDWIRRWRMPRMACGYP